MGYGFSEDRFFFSLKCFSSQPGASSLSLNHSRRKTEGNSALFVEETQHCFVFTPVPVCPAHTAGLIDFNWQYKRKRIWHLISVPYPSGRSQSQWSLAWLCWLTEGMLWLTRARCACSPGDPCWIQDVPTNRLLNDQ